MRVLLVLPILLVAAPVSAQVVTEVRAADTLLVHHVGVIKLLGVEGLMGFSADTREGRCAAAATKAVYQIAHTKMVRLVRDQHVAKRADLASHYYVYLPDGRMLNQVVLETGCARTASYVNELGFGQMLASVAAYAQTQRRGLHGPDPSHMAAATASVGRRGVTMAGFDQISLGMTRSNVESILGSFGSELSRNETSSFTLSRMEWKTADGDGWIMISFEDDRVRSKSHYGLK